MSGVVDRFDEVQQQIKEVEERKGTGIPPIPRRPLTAYNIFSILERHYILQQHYKSVDSSEAVDTPDETNDSTEQDDPYVSTRPARYKDAKLPPSWYIVGMNSKKRSEHKCHGMISFKALSKIWSATSDEVKAYCKMIYKEELTKYYQEQAVEAGLSQGRKSHKKEREKATAAAAAAKAKSEGAHEDGAADKEAAKKPSFRKGHKKQRII
jgi:hypothetical protein